MSSSTITWITDIPSPAIRLRLDLWSRVVEACRRDNISHAELVARAERENAGIGRSEAVLRFLGAYY
jgi:hypothetical protein